MHKKKEAKLHDDDEQEKIDFICDKKVQERTSSF